MIGKRAFVLGFYKAAADLKSESARYFAGIAWWFLEPILHMAVNYLVFAVVLGRQEKHFVAFLLIGLVLWRWMTAIVLEGCSSILSEKWLINQVYVPKAVFPMVGIFTHTFKFLLVFAVLLGYLWLDGFAPNGKYLYLPYLLLAFLTLISGMTFLAAALIPFMPDLKILVDHAFRLGFFLSGIFFSINSLSAEIQRFLYLNPIAHLIEAARCCLLDQPISRWAGIHASLFLGVALAGLGLFLLRHFDAQYAKISF